MLQTFIKRFSLTNCNGNSWSQATGFEQVINDGIPTYYIVDYSKSSIAVFNQYWICQSYQYLPYPSTYTTRYVGGYFYFGSNDYFYKTNTNYAVVKSYYFDWIYYRQFFYDSTVSKFFAAAQYTTGVDVFDTNCNYLQTIDFLNLNRQGTYGLASFNGYYYVGDTKNNKIYVIKNGLISSSFYVSQCPLIIYSITFDSNGYMVVSCTDANYLAVYYLNGVYTSGITTSYNPYMTAIDYYGRFIIVTQNSVDIYY